jgi:hypothetical protein
LKYFSVWAYADSATAETLVLVCYLLTSNAFLRVVEGPLFPQVVKDASQSLIGHMPQKYRLCYNFTVDLLSGQFYRFLFLVEAKKNPLIDANFRALNQGVWLGYINASLDLS